MSFYFFSSCLPFFIPNVLEVYYLNDISKVKYFNGFGYLSSCWCLSVLIVVNYRQRFQDFVCECVMILSVSHSLHQIVLMGAARPLLADQGRRRERGYQWASAGTFDTTDGCLCP